MQILFALYSKIVNNVIIQVLVLVWPGLGPRVCSFFGCKTHTPPSRSHGTAILASASLLRWSRNSTSSWRACARKGDRTWSGWSQHTMWTTSCHFLIFWGFQWISPGVLRIGANSQGSKCWKLGRLGKCTNLLPCFYFDTCAANGLCSSSDAQARPFLSLQRRTTGPQAHVLRLKLLINEGKLPLNVSKPISCWDVKRPAIPPAAASTLHGSALASSSAWKIALQIWRGLAWTILIYFAKVNPWNNDLNTVELWWNNVMPWWITSASIGIHWSASIGPIHWSHPLVPCHNCCRNWASSSCASWGSARGSPSGIQLPWGSISQISHIQSVNVSIAQSYSNKKIQYIQYIYKIIYNYMYIYMNPIKELIICHNTCTSIEYYRHL